MNLWNTTHAERQDAAERIMARRGYQVREVYDLSSGLYATVELTDGTTRTIGVSEMWLAICLANHGSR